MASKDDAEGPTTLRGGSESLQRAQQELQSLIEAFTELGVIVHDYPDEPYTKTAMQAKFQAINTGLKDLESTADQLADVEVPLDVLGYIDAGRNPDVYSREFVELSVKQNQLVNGKMRAARAFENALVDVLCEEFPDLSENLKHVQKLTGGGSNTK